ncbi:MAG: type II toxin-antitoxin system VapC family toxin [Candidatus Omnitrophica bacterium]|nr:type II toxin-antitoxin system VapC family toxin [Candidatus Omnitrophota bacterium]
MRLFVDTSAFVKRYIEETGTAEVERLLGDAGDVAFSPLVRVEVFHVLRRHRLEGRLTLAAFRLIWPQIEQDLRAAHIVPWSADVEAESIRVLDRFTLRSLDAIHVGAAVLWDADGFLTADKKLMSCAKDIFKHSFLV